MVCGRMLQPTEPRWPEFTAEAFKTVRELSLALAEGWKANADNV